MRRYNQKSVEVGVLRSFLGHFERKFETEGGVMRFRVVSKYLQFIVWFCHKARV